MNPHMAAAIEEAFLAVRSGDGGPFGAVIVKDGRIIARGHNRVLSSNDPTSHAEICAIREATAKLGRFDLSDCEIYTSCEPCPMCYSAIHWAHIPVIHQGCNRNDAMRIGFDDEFLYNDLKGVAQEKRVRIDEIDRDACLSVFHEWEEKKDKTPY